VPAVPRLLRAAILGAIAVAVIAPATAAHADPSARDTQQQINQSNTAFEKIVEQYNAVGEQLKATQAQADDLNTKMAPLQSSMDAAYANVGQIAVRAYKGGGVSPLAALLSDGSTNGLIDELTSLDHLARAQQADISSYTQAKAQYQEQKTKLDGLFNQQRTDQKNLADQKTKIESDLANLMALRKKAFGAATAAASGSGSSGSGSSGSGSSRPAPPAPNVGGGAGAAVRYAYAALGKPYVFAAAGPNSFDCSGLTMAAWRAGGRSLPHNAAMQWNAVAHISRGQLQPGDLVFYSGLGHVAVFVGNDTVIHAPHPGASVQTAGVNMMSPYGYGRVR
jgi:cell wall-associated NlpC family hydrolase